MVLGEHEGTKIQSEKYNIGLSVACKAYDAALAPSCRPLRSSGRIIETRLLLAPLDWGLRVGDSDNHAGTPLSKAPIHLQIDPGILEQL